MPLHRRLPKRGFANIFKKQYGIVNVGDLAGFEPNSVIDPQALMGAGVLKRVLDGVKMLGEGEVIHPFSVKVQKVSRTARQKIEAAGGTVQVI
jgi:large subunit ribosomal protein L15